MTFEQIFEKESIPLPVTDEELAKDAVLLYKNGSKANIPQAIVKVFSDNGIEHNDSRFNTIKNLAEQMIVKLEKKIHKTTSPKPRYTGYKNTGNVQDYKMRQAKDL